MRGPGPSYVVDVDAVNLEVRVGMGLAGVDDLLDGDGTEGLVLATAL